MAETEKRKNNRADHNADFPRLLMLLRKERGMSQKQVAEDLGISQALLSHYEKGIRECGLDFVVRAANYYGVSCDYLLGRTPQRTGAVLAVDREDLPDGETPLEVERRMLGHTVNIVFALLEKIKNESLNQEFSTYLEAAVYKIFRNLYSANAANPQALFTLDAQLFGAAAASSMAMAEARGRYLLSGESIGGAQPVEKEALPLLNAQELTRLFPEDAPALLELIRKAEKGIQRA